MFQASSVCWALWNHMLPEAAHQSRILKQRGAEVWGENSTHLVHHKHLIRNGKWGKELFLMQIYKFSWCDQTYVWEERFLPLHWTHFLPLETGSRKVYPSLPETNASVQKPGINPPEFPHPTISKTNEPKTFVGRLPTYFFLFQFIIVLATWALRGEGWSTTSSLLGETGKHMTTKTRSTLVWYENSFLQLAGPLGLSSFVESAVHLAKPRAQLEGLQSASLSAPNGAVSKFVTRPRWKEQAICWSPFRCRKSCVYYLGNTI